MSDPTLAIVYAALILHDGEAEVSSANMKTLVEAANIQGIEGFWYGKFEAMLATKDISELLTNISSGGPAPAAGAAAGTLYINYCYIYNHDIHASTHTCIIYTRITFHYILA